MKKLSILICYFFFSFSGFSQSYEELYKSANSILYEQTEDALILANKAKSLIKNNDDVKFCEIEFLLGEIYYFKSEYSKSINHYMNGLERAKKIKNDTLIGAGFAGVGLIHDEENENELALKNYEKGLNYYQKSNHLNGISSSYNNIGLLFYKQKEYSKAIECLEKCLEIDLQLNNKSNIAYTYSNLGSMYLQNGNYENSLKYHEKSLALRQELDDKYGLSKSYNNIANVYIELKNFKKANDYYLMSLNLKKEIGNKKELAITLTNYGRFLSLNFNNLSDGLFFVKQGQTMLTSLGNSSYLRDNLLYSAEIFEKLEIPDSALAYYKKYIASKDLLLSEKRDEQFTELMAKFKASQTEKELSLHKTELLEKENQLKESTINQLFLFGGSVISVLILLLLYKFRFFKSSY